MTRRITAEAPTTKSGPGATQLTPINDGTTVTSHRVKKPQSFGEKNCLIFYVATLHKHFTMQFIKNFTQLFCMFHCFTLPIIFVGVIVCSDPV